MKPKTKVITAIALLATLSITSLDADIFSDGKKSVTNILSSSGAQSVQDIIKDLNDAKGLLDLLFDNFSLNSLSADISGDDQLFQCIASGIDLPSLDGLGLGGLCDLVDMDGLQVGGFDLGSLAKCVGVQMPDLGLDQLKNLCSGSGSGGEKGGMVSDSTPDNPAGWAYTPPVVSASETINLSGITESTTAFKPKKTGERKYPSKKTGEEIYGTNGGILNDLAAKHSASAQAQAVKNYNKPALVLSDLALKSVGSADPTAMKLPLTKKDALDTEDMLANQIAGASVNFHDLIDSLASQLQNTFKSIEADNLPSYYSKEKAAFNSFLQSNETLKAVYEASAKAIKLKYAAKLFLLTQRKDYIDDPSEARAAFVANDKKISFRYMALVQQYRNANIKTDLALELKRNKQLIDIAAREAYARASLFRGDIAKKELDKMLRAVDTIIQ